MIIEMASDASKELFNSQIEETCNQMDIPKHESFLRWICQNIIGISDEGQIDGAVSVDGKNDYGVDIFYTDDSGDATERYVCWVQAKFSEGLNYVVGREEMEAFANTLNHLKDCPDLANNTFKQKSVELARMEAKYPGIKKRMIFAVAGRFNDQVNDMISNVNWMEAKFGVRHEDISLETFDLDRIFSYLGTPPTPQARIEFISQVIEQADAVTSKKSITGYVSAESLIELAKKNYETMFLVNPRQTLGSTAPTHKAIQNTLSNTDARKKFWKLNNGVTAICKSFKKEDVRPAYLVEDFKIVNGRQTIYSLEESQHPIEDVFLMMTIHEAVNEEERNQISQATNTQNPIKPVDLVSNYPEMTDLVLQCKERFPDFYFERQTNGFTSAKKSVQARITSRRVLEKSATARAYYAYMIDPSQAMMQDKVMFSTISVPNHYEMVFKNRKIEELLIPHIFAQILNGLHKAWCTDLKDSPSAEISRNKEIISKNVVKYYILRFIYESMTGLEESQRESIKSNMIEKFQKLKAKDPLPQEFLDIVEAAYNAFMTSYDMDRNETWPQDLLKRVNSDKYEEQEDDIPTPIDIMYMLKDDGDKLLPHLLRTRKHMIKQTGDKVQQSLLKLSSR